MAEKVGVEPSMPRVVKRQKNKSNNPAETPEEHFKRNVAIPFLDHIISNLDTKFDGNLKLKHYFIYQLLMFNIL